MEIREQQISLFVVAGIPEDFRFETKTRKEISVSVRRSSLAPEQTLLRRKLSGSGLLTYLHGNEIRRFRANSISFPRLLGAPRLSRRLLVLIFNSDL